MVRPARIEYPGALYHVVARGNQRQDLFHDDADRVKYLVLLSEYKQRFPVSLYAYVLRTDHIHLLLETRGVALGRLVQGIHQGYTRYYNRRYQTFGHVFQGRYKVSICARDAYLLELVRYLHLSPVRAKLVTDPADYPWSGHRSYLGLDTGTLVDTQPVLERFADQPKEARRSYREFVWEALLSPRRPELYQRVLGDRAFKEAIESHRPAPRDQAGLAPPTADEILRLVCQAAGVSRSQVIGPSRLPPIALARRLFVQACRYTGVPGSEVAKRLRRDPALISRMGRVAEADQVAVAQLFGSKATRSPSASAEEIHPH